MKKTLMIVTTGRADYGLLYPLIRKISSSKSFELKLIATGTHLSSYHGESIRLIEEDKNVEITERIEMTAEGDTEYSICYSIARGLEGFSQLLKKTSPDLIIVLGDRYELLSVGVAAVIHKIPIAHIHGGELSAGQIDDSIRHSITKMSAFHFASMDIYARRIIQMGESPDRVHVVGALGVDNIISMPLLTLEELSNLVDLDFNQRVALLTFHPVTLDSYDSAGEQVQEVLNALLESDLLVLMTMPNSDTANRLIYKEMEKFCEKYPKEFKLVKNLGQRAYLSAMKYSDIMVGNSSSGIIEAASFKLPVVNIGDRQEGRFKSLNIIDCVCSKIAIKKALDKALSEGFIKSVINLKSPYGDGNASLRIIDILESIDFNNKSQYLKKGFYDLKYDLSLENININKTLD